jgi:hypothetical protein
MRTLTRIAVAGLIGFTLPAGAARAADAAKPVSFRPEQLVWVSNPAVPEVLTAVTWGDPASGAHGGFHKFKAGFASPLHTHSANLHIVVLSGTMAAAGADGKETQFPAGSFYAHPNTFKHTTKCLEGSDCVVYVEADGKWDLVPVAGK